MGERTDFIKIRVNIMIDPSIHFVFDEDGKLKWNKDKYDEFYNADAKWREPILTFINEAVGLHNWAIRFQPFSTDEYEAYIFCPTDEDFHKIVTIIHERIKGVNFRSFVRKGVVDDYIAGR